VTAQAAEAAAVAAAIRQRQQVRLDGI